MFKRQKCSSFRLRVQITNFCLTWGDPGKMPIYVADIDSFRVAHKEIKGVVPEVHNF